MVRYVSVKPPQDALRRRLREPAQVAYGHRRLHVLLRREGWKVNARRVYRWLYSTWTKDGGKTTW